MAVLRVLILSSLRVRKRLATVMFDQCEYGISKRLYELKVIMDALPMNNPERERYSVAYLEQRQLSSG